MSTTRATGGSQAGLVERATASMSDCPTVCGPRGVTPGRGVREAPSASSVGLRPRAGRFQPPGRAGSEGNLDSPYFVARLAVDLCPPSFTIQARLDVPRLSALTRHESLGAELLAERSTWLQRVPGICVSAGKETPPQCLERFWSPWPRASSSP